MHAVACLRGGCVFVCMSTVAYVYVWSLHAPLVCFICSLVDQTSQLLIGRFVLAVAGLFAMVGDALHVRGVVYQQLVHVCHSSTTRHVHAQ